MERPKSLLNRRSKGRGKFAVLAYLVVRAPTYLEESGGLSVLNEKKCAVAYVHVIHEKFQA